tara:strand:- start:199 stop:369 length:171 start_codon:yes stop_codon:yes gene_type:complete
MTKIIEIDLTHFSHVELKELDNLIDMSIDYSIEDDANQINFEAVEVIGQMLKNWDL